MSGVQTTLALQDRLTGPLMKMMKAMDQTIRVMEKMDQAANKVDMKSLTQARSTIQTATADMERLIASSSSAGAGLAPLRKSFVNLPGPIHSAKESVKDFFESFAGAAAAYLSIQALGNGISSFVNASDTYVSTSARLENINDGLQTQAKLQQKVYEASQRSRTGYVDMANSVAKLNLLAKDAFSGNDEAIKFSELMGKAFTVSGASTQERQAGMYQLTQAMAAGRLQGDEFRSIMENAPLLAKAIADSTGKTMGDLKDMSADGVITANIVKSALFKAADDIEKKFKNMPMTFAQGWTMFKNWSLQAFEPLFIRFSQFVNSDAFGVLAGHAMWFVNMFITGMSALFDLLEWGYTEIGALGEFIASSWSTIAPYIVFVGGALAGYLGVLATLKMATAIAAAYQWALNAAVSFHAAAAMASTGATFAQTAAQYGLNAAMYAFPGTWILIAFVAVIALVVYALYAWGEQTATVIGFITGLFLSLTAYVYNAFAYLWNILVSFAEFLINLFIDPVYAIKKLFYDLGMNFLQVMHNMAVSVEGFSSNFVTTMYSAINMVLGGINGLIGAMNNIPGFDIPKLSLIDAGNVNFASNKLSSMMAKLNAMKPVSTKGVVDFSSAKLGQMNLNSAFKIGNTVGKNATLAASNKLNSIVDKAKGLISGDKFQDSKLNPFKNAGGALNPLEGKDSKNPTGGKLDKIGKIDDDINIADEDLKVLRELAERKSIQNIITLTPTVNFEGTVVREETDINKIKNQIETIWKAEANEVGEGDYS